MRTLLEFRAGKMKLEDGKLSPDSRRGRVKIVKDDDGLVRVQWTPDNAVVEDDVIVMPGQADFKKVGPQTQRVYQLKFKDKSCTLFFWMQESDSTKDASITQSFDAIINQTGGEGIQIGQSSAGGHSTGVPDASALAQMLSQIASCSSEGESSEPRRSGPTLQQQAVLGAALLTSAFKLTTGVPQESLGPSLADVLQPEILCKYIKQPDMLDRLAEFLPETLRTQEKLEIQCLSPQLHQQLQTFSTALLTGQFDPAALGLKVEGYSTIDFLNAIQKMVDEEKAKKESQ